MMLSLVVPRMLHLKKAQDGLTWTRINSVELRAGCYAIVDDPTIDGILVLINNKVVAGPDGLGSIRQAKDWCEQHEKER